MGRLVSWKEAELRELAAQFRRRARETKLPKYIELLNHAADDLQMQADLLASDSDDSTEPPHHLDLRI